MKNKLHYLTFIFSMTFFLGISQVPANDLIENAIEITERVYTENNLRLDLATNAGQAGLGCIGDGFPVAYYKFEAATDGEAIISLQGGFFNGSNQISLFYTADNLNATSAADLTFEASQACQFNTGITISAVQGQAYYIAVHNTEQAPSTVNVTLPEPPISNDNFSLGSNGVTCLCPDAEFGEEGSLIINGVTNTFTKRTETELRNLINANVNDPQIVLTCTSGIDDMSRMFYGLDVGSFNQNIESWDVSSVTTMSNMFSFQSSFNQPLNSWDVSSVTSMNRMFSSADSFNQPLNNWDVSNVTEMSGLFGFSNFNQPLNTWNVSNVTNMNTMFSDSTFDNDLSNWSFNEAVQLLGFLNDSAFSIDNYDSLLQSLDAQNLEDLSLGALNVVYCDAQSRTNLTETKGWIISGDILGQCGETSNPSTTPFVTTWTVENDLFIDIYTNDIFDYDFTVDWGDGQTTTNRTTGIRHNYAAAGTYTVSITGVFPYFKSCQSTEGFFLCSNAKKLSSVESWGDQEWRLMAESFARAENFNINTSESPDLSRINSLRSTFRSAKSFNQNINNWDVSAVTDMSNLFSGATAFNAPLNNWDVSKVSNMTSMFFGAAAFNQSLEDWDTRRVPEFSAMFRGASSFNQPLNDWDTSNVTNMGLIFFEATAFNQPLDNWDVSNLTDMSSMFFEATAFNQPLDNWDVSQVTNMNRMFYGATAFDQNLNNWDVSNVTSMSSMFSGATAFNQPLDNWDVSQVTNMNGMFYGATAFNQPLNSWDVSSVRTISQMFGLADSFNQPLNNWDVSNVASMWSMFFEATAFNQPLDNWDTSSVIFMSNLFNGAASFNQDISSWCVEQIPTEPTDFSLNSGLQVDFLPNWGAVCEALSLNDESLASLKLYPNPALNEITLLTPYMEAANVVIYDLQGRLVMSKVINGTSNSFKIDNLQSGTYFMKVQTEDSNVVRQFVKQ